MGLLSDLALRRVHAGPARRIYELFIGGTRFTSQVLSLNVEFDPRGGSGMTLQIRDSLEGLEDAPVELRLGYGSKAISYFTGTLQEPANARYGQAVAYGPFRAMASQSFGEQVSYLGVTVDYALRDLARRANYSAGMIEVIGGSEYQIENVSYTEETKLLEAAQAISEPAHFVFYDRPGFRRRAMPIPKPGATGAPKAVYTESNYSLNGFKVKETRAGQYSKVVIFRRNAGGGYEVREEAPVPNRGAFTPPANRIYYVPEYPGNSAAANNDAYLLANRLAFGALAFTLNDIWINPELEPWDVIQAETTERRGSKDVAGRPQKRGKWRVVYNGVISDGLSLDIGPERHHMSLSGGATKLREFRLPDPIKLSHRVFSPGIIAETPHVGLKPHAGLKPRRGPLKPSSPPGLKPHAGLKPGAGLKPSNPPGLKPHAGLKPRRGPLKPSATHFA